jgi:hypothetical protein
MAENERQANITIEVGPLGLTVRCEYSGSLASIPAAIERLKQAGVVELVSGARHTAPLGNGKAKAERVEPVYQPDGTPCCPVHRKPLSEGRYGLYCPAKAKPGEEQNDKGYCNLKFAE